MLTRAGGADPRMTSFAARVSMAPTPYTRNLITGLRGELVDAAHDGFDFHSGGEGGLGAEGFAALGAGGVGEADGPAQFHALGDADGEGGGEGVSGGGGVDDADLVALDVLDLVVHDDGALGAELQDDALGAALQQAFGELAGVGALGALHAAELAAFEEGFGLVLVGREVVDLVEGFGQALGGDGGGGEDDRGAGAAADFGGV